MMEIAIIFPKLTCKRINNNVISVQKIMALVLYCGVAGPSYPIFVDSLCFAFMFCLFFIILVNVVFQTRNSPLYELKVWRGHCVCTRRWVLLETPVP